MTDIYNLVEEQGKTLKVMADALAELSQKLTAQQDLSNLSDKLDMIIDYLTPDRTEEAASATSEADASGTAPASTETTSATTETAETAAA